MISVQLSYPMGIFLGSHFIYFHMIADFLAFTLGYQLFRLLRKKSGDVLREDDRLMLIVAAAIGALVGSRLLAALESPSTFMHPPNAFYYIAGSTILGGLLGGTMAVELVKKIKGITTRTGDQLVFPLILGIVIGRIGCLVTGVVDRTVGLPATLPWAFAQGDGIPRHPTALYEMLFLLLLAGILYKARRQFSRGMLYRTFLCAYAAFRLLIEFIKPREILALGLSAIQWACVLALLYYGLASVAGRRKSRTAPVRLLRPHH